MEQMVGHLSPVHLRHPYVEKDKLRLFGLGPGNPRRAVKADGHREPPRVLEAPLDELTEITFIINDEYL